MESLEVDLARTEDGAVAAKSRCANCEAPLLGPHCYACGQPVKGMVRHFRSILGDLFDTLLALDSRILRTLGPLLLRPGFITCEYFSGRRVRYVSPVRLFIFLCLTAFFVARLSSDWSGIEVEADGNSLASAESVEEVQQIRDKVLAGLASADGDKKEMGTPGVALALDAAESAVRRQAELRIAELEGEAPQTADMDKEACLLNLDNGCWNPRSDAIDVAVFPQGLNDWLTAQAVRAGDNMSLVREDPNRFKKALFGAIPSMLFFLLPVFALMLWCMYLFRRRLYMEHLIVALHSHAFLCLALLLITVLADFEQWLGKQHSVAGTLCDWASALLLLWMPLYLLLMQKRVYGQGWAMTLLKFSVLGASYSALLAAGAVITVLASLAGM